MTGESGLTRRPAQPLVVKHPAHTTRLKAMSRFAFLIAVFAPFFSSSLFARMIASGGWRAKMVSKWGIPVRNMSD
jgi:hypothetical protein